ncbi:hypothetical protein GCM10009634_73780 [Saccharothrix xinjiangensis]
MNQAVGGVVGRASEAAEAVAQVGLGDAGGLGEVVQAVQECCFGGVPASGVTGGDGDQLSSTGDARCAVAPGGTLWARAVETAGAVFGEGKDFGPVVAGVPLWHQVSSQVLMRWMASR